MIDKDTCVFIIEKYYDTIYKFCLIRLKNIQAAEDCAQEVFLVLFRKRSSIELTGQLLSWLYETANRICMKYLSKHSSLSVDIQELADVLPDKSDNSERELINDMYDILGKEDADLFLEYINAEHGERERIAKRKGITMTALYKQIAKLRSKMSDKYNR